MSTTVDRSLNLLAARGLISLVRADADMLIVSALGSATAEFPIGAPLCESIPVLFGMEEAVRGLRKPGSEQLVISNIALVRDDGSSDRQDFVVLHDPDSDGYLVMITPSFPNDDLSIELEQNLRKKLQLESRVAAQASAIAAANDALKRTNADLQNFTRIISHDLKAPMRAIRYSAEDIGASLSETDDPEQLVALNELRQQSMRLSHMVTDLLTYSRLGDKATAIAPVDTGALIQEIVGSLPRPDGLEINVSGNWPELETIGVLLDVVLRNLIDNAIKHHDRSTGEIRVEAEMLQDALCIIVMDDGPGIPDDYQQAVLRPFVKVNKEHSQSSGLGLSMVHKVVADVGGELNIGHRPDGKRGARITVHWPLTIVAT